MAPTQAPPRLFWNTATVTVEAVFHRRVRLAATLAAQCVDGEHAAVGVDVAQPPGHPARVTRASRQQSPQAKQDEGGTGERARHSR
jgi:hypothetical protein